MAAAARDDEADEEFSHLCAGGQGLLAVGGGDRLLHDERQVGVEAQDRGQDIEGSSSGSGPMTASPVRIGCGSATSDAARRAAARSARRAFRSNGFAAADRAAGYAHSDIGAGVGLVVVAAGVGVAMGVSVLCRAR